MAVKKAKKRAVKKSEFQETIEITIGRKHKSDRIVPLRVGVKLARQLKSMADGRGVIQITEAEFIGAITGRDEVTMGPEAEFNFEEAIDLNADLEQGPTVLDEAKSIIYGDREQAYGDPRFNLDTIAQLWTVYLNRKFPDHANPFIEDLAFTGEDVAQFMILLKTARLIHRPDHRDSLTDQAGYAALQARIQGL